MNAAAVHALSLFLRTGNGLSDAERERIARGLEAYVSSEADTLDAALGLKPGPGQRDARTCMALEARDEIVRQIASEFFEGEAPAAQAAAIARHWSRYAAAGWPRERTVSEMPARRVGTVEGALWRAMKLRDHPLRERTIRAILSPFVPRLAAS